MSTENPYPDLHGAPVYLPDTGEMSLEPEKWFGEIKWMAQQFWSQREELEKVCVHAAVAADAAYDEGYQEGYDEAADA